MNYILGGGLTGLLLLEMPQFKDFMLLTNGIGGQLTQADFNLGPRILHHSKTVNKFLNNIGITKKPKEFKLGYLINGGVDFYITSIEKNEYYEKTRGNKNINSSCLSGGKKFIEGWDINDINLIDILYKRNFERIRMVKSISKIDVDKKLIDGKIAYDKLVSTLNLELMHKLLGGNLKIKKKAVYYHYAKKWKDEDLLDIFKLDYLYCITDPSMNRISITKDKNYRVIESNYDYIYSTIYDVKKVVKLNSQITNELKLDYILDIPLIGRYAQYDHGIKANNIIDKYYKGVK